MFGPIMLTIGKNIQVERFPGWITKRVRASMGTLGLESTDIIWTDSTYLAVSTMNSLVTYLSSAFFLGREIFRICWATSSGQDRLSNIFKDIVSLLKGTRMTNIILIDEYLYSRYRELLSIRLLAENHKGMLAAWAFLAKLPENEMYFAKILYDKETTACLNRNNFPLHIAAAVSAARFELPTMLNYRGAESQIQSSTLLANIVHTYLTKRLTI
jgi:DNA polymerase III delta prime subunit